MASSAGPAIFIGSGAPSLTTDGVDVGAPGKTKDEACAPPVIAARMKPSAPRIRTDTMTTPLAQEAGTIAPVIDAGLQGNIAF